MGRCIIKLSANGWRNAVMLSSTGTPLVRANAASSGTQRRKEKSRYNLICTEHAILGNLAYLAGTNLARWEVWEGIRAVDYLLSRSDVDPERSTLPEPAAADFKPPILPPS